MLTELLSGHGLCLLRGDKCLFKSLDFALNGGELLVVEGPNGSGKTSLLRGIAGLLDFEEGEIRWKGQPARRNLQYFRSDLVWFSHKVGLKADLDIAENLRFEASLRPTRWQAYGSVLERLNLNVLAGLPIRSLSAGQQRRVALSRMLLAEARLWIMDEPFTNLDKAGHKLVQTLLSEHVINGGGAIVASHQALEIEGKTRRIELS